MLDLAVIVFKHAEGADHAYADVLGEHGDASWVHEIALVEHHRHDRLVVRGTFAGRGPADHPDGQARGSEDRAGASRCAAARS